MGHEDQGGGRGLQRLELIQIRIALATDLKDLLVKRRLGWEMAEQQGFRNAGRFGNLLGGGAGEAPAREQGRGDFHDRRTPIRSIHAP